MDSAGPEVFWERNVAAILLREEDGLAQAGLNANYFQITSPPYLLRGSLTKAGYHRANSLSVVSKISENAETNHFFVKFFKSEYNRPLKYSVLSQFSSVPNCPFVKKG